MKFRDFIRILLRHGFKLDGQSGSSDRVYKGRVGGSTRLVVVACHSENDDIKPGTFGINDPTVGTAQTDIPRMRASGGKRHRELMALSVAITACEQAAQRMGQELEPDRERSWTMQQGLPFLRRQVCDASEVKRDRFPERTEYLLERAALDGDVEIEANRLPRPGLRHSSGDFWTPMLSLSSVNRI